MLDLGLSKMALIGVVALLVIGPKDLPKVARMAGTLLGRAQRYINQVKSEVSREMELEALRKVQSEVETAAQEVEQSIRQEVSKTQSELIASWQDKAEVVDSPYMTTQYIAKVKSFRRKKLVRQSALPAWYKNRHGHTQRVVSGAARMSRHRVSSKSPASFF